MIFGRYNNFSFSLDCLLILIIARFNTSFFKIIKAFILYRNLGKDIICTSKEQFM